MADWVATNKPGRQLAQREAPKLEKKPLPQLLQAVVAVEAAKNPPEQLTHAEARVAFTKSPRGHGRHDALDAEPVAGLK